MNEVKILLGLVALVGLVWLAWHWRQSKPATVLTKVKMYIERSGAYLS
jgi:hypothetical protein